MQIEAGMPFTLAAQRFSEREAIRDAGRSLTYRELSEAANRFGSGLAARGIAQGDRVGILSFNRTEVVEMWLGLERANIVRVVLHSHFEMEIHVGTLTEIDARVLVFDSRFADAVDQHRRDMRSVRLFVCIGGKCPDWAVPYDQIMSQGNTADLRIDVDEDAPCFLQLTSGTTGNPKPWTHTHRSWRAVIANNIEHLDNFSPNGNAIGPDDVNLHFHALQWATGFQTLMPYLLKGARTVLLDDAEFDAKAVAEAFAAEGATGTLMPAPALPDVLDVIERQGLDLGKMKRMVIFFATPELLERTTKVIGPVWCHGFGSTEQGAPTTRLTAQDMKDDPRTAESVGRPASSFFELAIMDEAGNRLGVGGVGEIVVRSAMSNGYYWGLPEKTEQCFFPGGWFRPEDIGYVDENGFLYYLDRAKDRIQTPRGVVYPHVAEMALLSHPSVASCGVVGIGEPGRQEVVGAVVTKNDTSAKDGLAAEILAHAGTHLSDRERVERVVFVDELPTVLGGAKVQREVLKQQLSETTKAAG